MSGRIRTCRRWGWCTTGGTTNECYVPDTAVDVGGGIVGMVSGWWLRCLVHILFGWNHFIVADQSVDFLVNDIVALFGTCVYENPPENELGTVCVENLVNRVDWPGTLATHSRCELQTWKDSRTSPGLLASITVTLPVEWVLVHIHTNDDNVWSIYSLLFLSSSCSYESNNEKLSEPYWQNIGKTSMSQASYFKFFFKFLNVRLITGWLFCYSLLIAGIGIENASTNDWASVSGPSAGHIHSSGTPNLWNKTTFINYWCAGTYPWGVGRDRMIEATHNTFIPGSLSSNGRQ